MAITIANIEESVGNTKQLYYILFTSAKSRIYNKSLLNEPNYKKEN